MTTERFPKEYLVALKGALAHEPRLDPVKTTGKNDLHRVRSGEIPMVETHGHLYDASWIQGLTATYVQYHGETRSILWTREENVILADILIWSRYALFREEITMEECTLMQGILLGYQLTTEYVDEVKTAELQDLIRRSA